MAYYMVIVNNALSSQICQLIIWQLPASLALSLIHAREALARAAFLSVRSRTFFAFIAGESPPEQPYTVL